MPIQSSQEWEQGWSDSNQNIRMLPAGLALGTEEGKSIQAEYRTEGSKTIQTAEKHRLTFNDYSAVPQNGKWGAWWWGASTRSSPAEGVGSKVMVRSSQLSCL